MDARAETRMQADIDLNNAWKLLLENDTQSNHKIQRVICNHFMEWIERNSGVR